MFSVVTTVHAEEKCYVSDELSTWVRSDPGDNYRLAGTINAGEEVSVLQANDSIGYTQVHDSSGRTAWTPLKELGSEPSLRAHVPDLGSRVKILTDKLNNADAAWNQRTTDTRRKVVGSDSAINALKDEGRRLKNKLVVARGKVSVAGLQLGDKQRTIIMQWFMYGDGVLGIGLLLGLTLPHLVPNRGRKDRWMN